MAGGMNHSHLHRLAEIKLAYKWEAWVTVLVAALFFFYEFIQMNMFNAISVDLMRAFDINAAQLGGLSSYYFIANVIFLFVAGSLLDRYSTKTIMLVSLLLCVVGTMLFAMATQLWWAGVCRFLTGIGSAFCFLSCIRLASRWFPAKRMALVTGFVLTMAMAGGMVAQTPMTKLVQHYTWRQVLYYDALLGLLIFFILALIVKDYPASVSSEEKEEHDDLIGIGYFESMRLAFARWQSWLAGIYTCLMNLPLLLLGGLWGNLYLVRVHGYTNVKASIVTSMLFIGTIVGSPLSGWMSDSMRSRKKPMFFGAVISLITILFICFLPALSYVSLIVLFFIVGLVTATQIISYPLVAESSPRMITAMSVSAVNITTQAGIAIFQPVYGYLMDLHVAATHPTTLGYLSGDFRWAMLIFPVGIIVSFLTVFLLDETNCQSLEERYLEESE